MIERVLVNVALFFSILFFPWWVSLSLGIVLIIFYAAIETVLWGLFFDSLYATGLPEFYGFMYLGTALFFVLLLVSIPVKRKMIFYDNAF